MHFLDKMAYLFFLKIEVLRSESVKVYKIARINIEDDVFIGCKKYKKSGKYKKIFKRQCGMIPISIRFNFILVRI